MAQTIGRVIRLNKQDASNIANGTLTPCNFSEYRKPFGKMFVLECMPTSVFLHTNVFSRLLTLSLSRVMLYACPLFVNNNEVTDAQILGLVTLFVLTLSIIIAGYFHGKMHLLTVLKNTTS